MKVRVFLAVAAVACLAQACGPKEEAKAPTESAATDTVTPEDEAKAEAAALAMPEEEVVEGEGGDMSEGEAEPPVQTGAVTGTLVGVEVGDNFYVIIKKANGEELSALCEAEQCQGWLDAGALPPALVGKNVSATVVAGEQTDSGGNVMGSYPAVSVLTIQP